MQRRKLLKTAGASALAFPTIIPAHVLGAEAPSKRITVGMIGVGNHGTHRNLNMFIRQPDARVVAVCDAYRSRAVNAQQMTDKHYDATGCKIHDATSARSLSATTSTR